MDVSGRGRGSHSAYLGVACNCLDGMGKRVRNKKRLDVMSELDCSAIDVSGWDSGGKTLGGNEMIE